MTSSADAENSSKPALYLTPTSTCSLSSRVKVLFLHCKSSFTTNYLQPISSRSLLKLTMRFSLATAVVVALAAEGAVASTWFGKAGNFALLLPSVLCADTTSQRTTSGTRLSSRGGCLTTTSPTQPQRTERISSTWLTSTGRTKLSARTTAGTPTSCSHTSPVKEQRPPRVPRRTRTASWPLSSNTGTRLLTRLLTPMAMSRAGFLTGNV